MNKCIISIMLLVDFISLLGSCGAQDRRTWNWSDQKSQLKYSIKRHLPDDFEMRYDGLKLNLIEKKTGKVIYSVESGNQHTVFARCQGRLFIAEYSPISTGCEVVAFDLSKRKTIWKSRLKGIGPTGHSQYWNLVNIECDDDKVTVYGNESHGIYVEQLNLKTGSLISNTVLKTGEKKWSDSKVKKQN